ncbi:universal stress protein [Natrinema versiforme]|uniref:UspA domain-containing protein n=1 Tax=Natrinema versiforme JCM 10478 TaxID=1227496 RepID=L9XZX9_9EURY|nr:universal stress protein [Natrinema versiforme]ELY66992.1 UspA domain-containing protein [Natrinema versiforme JCM 10478]
MYRVLLPVDDTESRARAQAAAVRDLPSAATDVSVDVLHVRDDAGGTDAEWAAGGFAEEYADEMERLQGDDSLPGSVEAAVDVLEEGNLEWTVRTATGDSAETILEAAAEYDSDVIVIGVRSRSPVGKVLFGSVAQAVILDSDRPVTVVPEN